MAPQTSESDLRKVIEKLEARVNELEQTVKSKSSQIASALTPDKSKSNKNGMRMVLMGPPGAGKINIYIYIYMCVCREKLNI